MLSDASQMEPAILVVDDDGDIRASLRDILLDRGYRADIAHDGPSALCLAEQFPYAVALLDYKMPGMDGATLSRELKHRQPNLVTIIITAYQEGDCAARARAAGTWRLLRKPVDLPSLLRLVDDATRQQHTAGDN